MGAICAPRVPPAQGPPVHVGRGFLLWNKPLALLNHRLHRADDYLAPLHSIQTVIETRVLARAAIYTEATDQKLLAKAAGRKLVKGSKS